MKKILSIIIAIMLSVSIASCSNDPEANDVYVTVYPLKFITERLFVNTDYSVGIVPGVTSHENSVDWSPKEIIAMTDAAYLFYVGGNYDQYIDFQINSIFVNKDVELVKIEEQTNYIQYIEGVVHTDDEETDTNTLGIDPHFWISPKKFLDATNLIYNKLIQKFPEQKYYMTENFDILIAELRILNDEYEAVIGASDKMIMTSTNIYGYLREDYGLNYISISPGYHEETEQFTTQEKEHIVTEAVYYDLRYIIYEKNTISPLSNAVFDELVSLDMNPQKLEFNILQTLSDEDIILGSNYITVMYDNLELLKQALGYESEQG